jgi:heat shock protein HslJ
MRNYALTILGILGFSMFRIDNNDTIRFTRWDLINIQTQKDGITREVKKTKPYLIIKDSVFYGDSGCNDFGGWCSLSNDSILFNRPVSTMIYCPEIHWVEDALYNNLMRGKAKYVIHNDTLIFYSKTSDVYRFHKSIDQRKINHKFGTE